MSAGPGRFRGWLAPLSGVGSAGSGILVAGFFTYLFLSLAGRVLGPAGFAPISALWSLVFIVGPGLFLPAQQELGRVLAGRRGDRSGRSAVLKVCGVVAGMSVVVMAGTLAAHDWLVRELFDGEVSLLWCFEGAVVAYAITFVARGVFSGLGDFKDFGLLIAGESVSRLVIGGALVLAGARSAATFGVAIALAPVVSAAVITRLGSRMLLRHGQEVTWRDVTRAMGWLVMGSLLAQTLANAGPVVVQVMAPPGEAGQAGRFLSALVLARLSLYLFQAVQATLLPNLAELVAGGRVAEVRLAIRRVTFACCVLLVTTTIGAWLIGPLAVRLLFGSGFTITSTTMALLACASSFFVLAVALSGAAIAARGHRLNAWSWLGGVAGFVIGMLAVHELFLRVELGYLLGSAIVAGALLVGLPWQLRRQGDSGEPVESWSAATQ